MSTLLNIEDNNLKDNSSFIWETLYELLKVFQEINREKSYSLFSLLILFDFVQNNNIINQFIF